MSFTRDYQKVVAKIYDECIAFPGRRQDHDDPSTWSTLQNDALSMPAANLQRILTDLQSAGAIRLCSGLNLPLVSKEHGELHNAEGVPLDDRTHLVIDYIVVNRSALQNKLVDLEESIASNEKDLQIIENIETDFVPYANVGDFSYNLGTASILYQDKPLECPRYLKLILLAMLQSEGRTTTFDDIRRVADKQDLTQRAISKNVGELRKQYLIPLLGYDPISSERDLGYLLKLQE